MGRQQAEVGNIVALVGVASHARNIKTPIYRRVVGLSAYGYPIIRRNDGQEQTVYSQDNYWRIWRSHMGSQECYFHKRREALRLDVDVWNITRERYGKAWRYQGIVYLDGKVSIVEQLTENENDLPAGLWRFRSNIK